MNPDILLGQRIPEATIGYLSEGEIRKVDAQHVFAKDKVVAIGVPGAFTPICTKEHIPDFVRNARKLKSSGFSKVLCIAPNDPFVVDEWARQLDPNGAVEFLSDGNLAFARALGLSSRMSSLLLGERSERFMIVTVKGVIQHFKVEPNILTYSCTRADDALLAA